MNRNKGGQSVVEVVIVIGLAAVLIVGIVNLVTISVRNANFGRTQAQASRYAQEALEWVRQQRDSSWTTFQSKAGSTYCMANLSWIGGPCSGTTYIPGTSFVRNVTVVQTGTDFEVNVTVSWEDAKGGHQSRTSTILTNWRGQ